MDKKFDIFGVGSALIDILVEVEDEILENLNLKKGTMTLINEEQVNVIDKEISKHQSRRIPGGATANACAISSQFGSKTAFCGTIGNDLNGNIYTEKTQEQGTKPFLSTIDKTTGFALTFITPDHERTFAVHLGAALELDRIHLPIDQIKNSKILHTESYLIGEPGGLKDACIYAMQIAKQNNVLVSLDLSAPNIVEDNREEIKQILSKYVDIVFANEDEAAALTHKSPKESLTYLSSLSDIAIVKLGKNGSLIKTKEKQLIIKPYETNELDTTGAGDSYAAAILHGIANNIPLEKSGELGSYIAAKVVSQIGARLNSIDQEKVNHILNN